MHDGFSFSTDLEAPPGDAASLDARRRSIECVNREVEQCLHAEDPRSWKGKGPERAASLSLWLDAAIWTSDIPGFGTTVTWTIWPWYQKEAAPSLLDALAALRRVFWAER